MINYEVKSYDKAVVVPAIYEDGNLLFVNNGISGQYFEEKSEVFKLFKRSEFNCFCSVPVLSAGPVRERPFFVRLNQNLQVELWEFFYVYGRRDRKKKALYTCITNCKPDTFFCTCDDCGKRFVLCSSQTKFYRERHLDLPTVRCPQCIQEKKIHFR